MKKKKITKSTIIAGVFVVIAIYAILYFTRTNLEFDIDKPIQVLSNIDGEINNYEILSSEVAYKDIKDIIEKDFYLPSAKILSEPGLDSITIYFESKGEQNEVKIISDGIVYLNQEHIQFKFATNNEDKYKQLKNVIEDKL